MADRKRDFPICLAFSALRLDSLDNRNSQTHKPHQVPTFSDYISHHQVFASASNYRYNKESVNKYTQHIPALGPFSLACSTAYGKPGRNSCFQYTNINKGAIPPPPSQAPFKVQHVLDTLRDTAYFEER